MIKAEKIADSIAEHSPRLLTIRAINPKFIHQETLRHRLVYIRDVLLGDPDWSFSVSSSRAIPFHKLLAEARDPLTAAKPVLWGAAQKGMSPGDEVDDTTNISVPQAAIKLYQALGIPVVNPYLTKRELAESLWDLHAELSAVVAEMMDEYTGVHKSLSNRLLEAHIHVHCLMTATAPGWLNFLALRLDKAADPTVRALAEACWKVWNESEPVKLKPGQWHLPFVDDLDEIYEAAKSLVVYNSSNAVLEIAKRISVARSAHLSYESFETGQRMTVERCLDLHDRFLLSRPLHASPFEHQATPDEYGPIIDDGDLWPELWKNPRFHGNLPGWCQYRKFLPGEAVAALPEGYR